LSPKNKISSRVQISSLGSRIREAALPTYARRDSLVDTQWVADHLKDPSVLVVEVDVDVCSYDEAHVPGAVGWDWSKQLCDTVRRDILSREASSAS
jgi:thiosulfate/3-mercaptopyruvate sulfurtransferase